MAEIGVLELEIKDNAKDAGTGLKSLADALYKVKAQTEGKIGLSKVGTELNALAKQINGTQSNTPTIIKNITSLMNSLTGFSKIKSLHIDTKSIDSLKNAVSGFNIGNAGTQMRSLQQALSSTWSTDGFAQSTGIIVAAANAFDSNGTAAKLTTLTSALTKYSKAYSDLPNSTKKMENVLGSFLVRDMKADYKAGLERSIASMEESGRNGIALNLQQFGGKGSGRRKQIPGQTEMDLAKAAESSFATVDSRIEEVTEAAKELNIQLVEIKDTVTSINVGDAEGLKEFLELVKDNMSFATTPTGSSAADQYEYMVNNMQQASQYAEEFYQSMERANEIVQNMAWNTGDMAKQFSDMFNAWSDMRSAFSLGSGSTAGFLGSGYIGIDQQETGWTYWKNGAIEVEGTVSEIEEEVGRLESAMEPLRLEGTTIFEELENTAKQFGISVDDLIAKIVEMKGSFDASTFNFGTAGSGFANIQEFADSIGLKLVNMEQNMGEAVSAAMDNVNSTTGTAETRIDLLRQKIAILQKEIDTGRTEKGTILSSKDINGRKLQIDSLMTQIEKLEAKAQKAREALDSVKTAPQDYSATYGKEMVDNLANYSKLDLMNLKLSGMRESLASDINANKVDTQQIAERMMRINELQEKIETLANSEEYAASATGKLDSAFRGLKSGIQKLFPSLSGLIKRFGNLIKYRALRAVIKHIADGFKEGWENLRGYKDAIGDSFSEQIKEANAQLLTMKNSIGAAVAPALQALLPVLQTIVSAIINVINWFNQLISLITGKETWTHAIDASADSLDNVAASAGGAGKAMKDLLADWDELNIIQSETGGGGGGGSKKDTTDYLSMFEEVDAFDERLKSIVDFVKRNLGDIATLAAGIGATLLGWKISKAFADSLPLLSKIGTGLATIGSITISLVLTDMFGKAYAETGDTGWFIADALMGAVGPFFAWQLAKRLVGSTGATAVAGFTLILEGAVNIVNAAGAMEQQQEGRAWALGALGSVEAGIGAALTALGLKATAGTAILAGAAAFGFTIGLTALVLIDAKNQATYEKMAYDAFTSTGENGISIQSYMDALQTRLNELTKDSYVVIDTSVKLEESQGKFRESIESLKSLNEFLTSGEALTEEQAKSFKAAWDIVFNELKQLGELSYETIFQGLSEAIKNGTEETKKAANELKKTAVEVARLTGGARAAAQEEMNQIITEISGGNMDRIDRYFELYNIWGKEDESSAQIDQILEAAKSKGFKFSEGGNAVEEAKEMLRTIQEEYVNPALEVANQQYEASMKGVKEQKIELQKALESGYITQEQFDNATAGLDKIAVMFKKRMDEQVAQINGISEDAYTKIADQLYEGYLKLDDNQSRQKYVDEIINPVLEVFKDAKRKIPDKLQNILQLGLGNEGLSNATNVAELAESVGRGSMFQIAFDELMQKGGYVDVEDAVLQLLASQNLTMQGNYENLSKEAQQEIVNGLLPLFSEFEAGNIIQYLHDLLGFDIETMLAGIDFSGLNGRKYTNGNGEEYTYETTDLIDAINEFIAEHNYNNPSNFIQPLDLTLFDEGFKNSIEVMQEWQNVMEGIKNGNISGSNGFRGIDFSLTRGGLDGQKGVAGIPYVRPNATQSFVNTGEGQAVEVDATGVENSVDNVSKEVQGLNSSQSSLLETLISVCRQIAAKENTVNIYPSSTFGLLTGAAMNLLGNRTGNE